MQDKPLPSMIGNVSNALVLELMKFKADHHQDHNLLVELFLSRRMAKSQLILRLLFNSLLEFLQQFAATKKQNSTATVCTFCTVHKIIHEPRSLLSRPILCRGEIWLVYSAAWCFSTMAALTPRTLNWNESTMFAPVCFKLCQYTLLVFRNRMVLQYLPDSQNRNLP